MKITIEKTLDIRAKINIIKKYRKIKDGTVLMQNRYNKKLTLLAKRLSPYKERKKN